MYKKLWQDVYLFVSNIIYVLEIINFISIILGKSKRPDAESIFKHLSSTSATNIFAEVVQESIKLLIAKSKVVNRKTKQDLDFFFITNYQLDPEVEKFANIINTLEI